MSEVEGVRKLLQDLVTPDLKSLQVQVANLEKATQTAIASLKESNQAALQSIEKSVQAANSSLRDNVDIRLDGISKLTAEQLKNQQLAITSSLEPKLMQILASIESLNTRVAYFESRIGSERHAPVWGTAEAEASMFRGSVDPNPKLRDQLTTLLSEIQHFKDQR